MKVTYYLPPMEMSAAWEVVVFGYTLETKSVQIGRHSDGARLMFEHLNLVQVFNIHNVERSNIENKRVVCSRKHHAKFALGPRFAEPISIRFL